MSAPIRLKAPPTATKIYTFRFSFGGLAALLTAFTLALTLFFVLGVVVGRGRRPERALPPVARIMPTESAAPTTNEVLKADELGYSRQLTKKGDSPVPARPIDPVKGVPPKGVPPKGVPPKAVPPEAAPDRTPPDRAKGIPTRVAPKTASKAAAGPAAKKAGASAAAAKPDADGRRYDYVYQAASFPDDGSAKAFVKKLKARGVAAGIEAGEKDGKTWRRVVVYFQGTPTDTRGLKAKLSGLGVARPLMRSKTPAE